MNPIVRNILAVVGGWIIGSIVNMGLIWLGPNIIPNPEGFDSSSAEAFAATAHLLKPINYIFPFLAHALGALAGSFAAYIFAATHKMKFALGVSALFLLGGIAAVMMFNSPLWFTVVDLVGAYIPMGWLGAKLAAGRSLSE
jgi:hypothetical protein